MDVHFKILGSSSSGNSALLQAAGSSVLIDAGMTEKKLDALLKTEGISSESLDAVFLTHEHNDHSAGLNFTWRMPPPEYPRKWQLPVLGKLLYQ